MGRDKLMMAKGWEQVRPRKVTRAAVTEQATGQATGT